MPTPRKLDEAQSGRTEMETTTVPDPEPQAANPSAHPPVLTRLRATLVWLWPWLALAAIAVAAVWHVIDFENPLDREYPAVKRLTFSRRPPAAYRLAEPGDTLDRIAIYASAAAAVVALGGLSLARGNRGLWVAAVALAAAGYWHAVTPGPTFDGWHGLGWRAIADGTTPWGPRIALALAAVGLLTLVAAPLLAQRSRWPELWRTARAEGTASLWSAAVIGVVLRQFEIPGVEPVGYWPRCAFAFGLVAFGLALLRALPPLPPPVILRRLAMTAAGCGVWLALVAGGIGMTWYHRPLARLRTVVPGRIYICAMPTARGLEVAQARHHFKTIINLFPEDTPLRSPLLPDELRFARSHGIHYVGSPSDDESSSAFLDQTLALAQDPSAWPILVHCHGCMDRTPAWMGIYRFVVQGSPLADVMQEIERHRGCLPKASVTLLYNRVLPPRAPERFAADPTAQRLVECARGTANPSGRSRRWRPVSANPTAAARVSGTADSPVR